MSKAFDVSRARQNFCLALRFALTTRSIISVAMSKKKKPSSSPSNQGYLAQADGMTLRYWTIGALPLINQILERMRLETFLEEHLATDGPRMKIPTRRGLLLLVRNILLSREPIYGLGEWAQRHAPELIGISARQLAYLNDDRIGRCLDRLFEGMTSSLIMNVVRHIVQEFDLQLDELHNDSTTVTFHGTYDGASEAGLRRGLPTLGITWGHNKDHRPNLKQLLYILTVTDDGGVPVYFTLASGNTADDQTHIETWELMRQLVGSADFLYVADCKLASSENLRTIDSRGGRFITVLPRTRREDKQFRKRLIESAESIRWEHLYDITDDEGEVLDRLSVADESSRTSDGFRLLWFFSERKAEQDALTRARQVERIQKQLTDLQQRLQSPKTRFRTRTKVEEAVRKILAESSAGRMVNVDIQQRELEKYTQATRGRPGSNTQYIKTVQTRYELAIDLNLKQVADSLATDGRFPLLTNADDLSAEEVLRAYKRQPLVEKRFSQFKNDFAVAPVYLKDVSRIQALLSVYFFALVVQTLLERELRRAMDEHQIDELPLYPEGRLCKAPTTRRLIELFEPMQRHELKRDRTNEVFVTKLSPIHRQILKLLGLKTTDFGK